MKTGEEVGAAEMGGSSVQLAGGSSSSSRVSRRRGARSTQCLSSGWRCPPTLGYPAGQQGGEGRLNNLAGGARGGDGGAMVMRENFWAFGQKFSKESLELSIFHHL